MGSWLFFHGVIEIDLSIPIECICIHHCTFIRIGDRHKQNRITQLKSKMCWDNRVKFSQTLGRTGKQKQFFEDVDLNDIQKSSKLHLIRISSKIESLLSNWTVFWKYFVSSRIFYNDCWWKQQQTIRLCQVNIIHFADSWFFQRRVKKCLMQGVVFSRWDIVYTI
jgi:hypothetical protein